MSLTENPIDPPPLTSRRRQVEPEPAQADDTGHPTPRFVGHHPPGARRIAGPAGGSVDGWLHNSARACRPRPVLAASAERLVRGRRGVLHTTDVSHADVAQAKGANFAPRLGLALPEGRAAPGGSSVDKVYAVTNFKQASVFASAPFPMGSTSRDTAYSPLWQMVKVTWVAGATPQVLRSEEDVLAAVDRGAAALEATRVVLNCPIVHRGPKGALPGVSITRPPR